MSAVDPRTPLRIVVTSDIDAIDIDALVEFSDRAFRQNYRGKVRVVYDADFYEWLLGGRDWFAVLALNEQEQPVGCALSLVRTLACRGEHHPTAYSTAWTVDPAYRRTGVSLRIWQALGVAIRERGYLGLGAAHGENSGTRGGVVFRDASIEPRVAVPLPSGAIWSRTLAGSASAGGMPVRMQRLCFIDGEYVQEDPDAPIGQDAYARLVESVSPLAFAPTGHFAQLYFNSELTRSGTMWFDLGGAQCAIGFSMFTLALDDAELGLTGRLQFVLPFGCDDAQLAAALEAMCGFLRRSGCSTATLVDQRSIPQGVLECCGFTPSEDVVTLSLGVPQALAERFRDLPSGALDFL